MSETSGTRRRRLTRILTVGSALALLLLVFRSVPLPDVLHAIGSAEPGKLAIGFVLLFGARLVAAWRMKLLTDRQQLGLTIPEIFEIGTSSTFYGLLLPGTLSGGLIRWYKLARQGNATGALAALTWDRLVDTMAVAILGVLAWQLSRPVSGHSVAAPTVLTLSAGLTVLYLAGFSTTVGDVVLGPLDRLAPRLRQGWTRGKIDALARAARSYHGLGAWFPAKVALYSLAVQLVSSVGFYCWAQALGAPVGLAEVAWAWACYSLVVLLPITFAGLGAREGMLILLLRPYGVTGADAVALSFIQLGGTLLLALVGGSYELRTLWRRRGADEAGVLPPPELEPGHESAQAVLAKATDPA